MTVFSTPLTVRFRDLDAMGHVNNAVFFTYFEEGRKHFFFNLYNVSTPTDFEFILAHIQCDYLRPIHLTSRLVLQMWVTDIGRKRFDLAYRLIDAGDETVVLATGESVQVCYDYKTEKSIEVPETLRQKLSEYRQA